MDTPHTTPCAHLSSVQAELATMAYRTQRLEHEMQMRSDEARTARSLLDVKLTDHDRLLVELAGQRGTNGRIGALALAVTSMAEDLKSLRLFQVKVLIWAAAGAGATNGIFESIKFMLS